MYTTGDIRFEMGACAVAVACLIAVFALAVRERRKTGAWPPGLVDGDIGPLRQRPLYVILSARIFTLLLYGEKIESSMPAALLLAGLDLSLALAMLGIAALAISAEFKSDSSRDVALRQTYFLAFAFFLCGLVIRDIHLYHSFAWIWIIAGVEAAFLTPLFARLAYVEYYQRYMEPPEAEAENASKVIVPPS